MSYLARLVCSERMGLRLRPDNCNPDCDRRNAHRLISVATHFDEYRTIWPTASANSYSPHLLPKGLESGVRRDCRLILVLQG